MARLLGFIVLIAGCPMLAMGEEKTTQLSPKKSPTINTSPVKQLFAGQVVLSSDIKKVPHQEKQKRVFLQTKEGKLIPVLNDWRGRAFLLDKRLRNRSVELIGVLRKQTIQVLVVYTFDKSGTRQYTDYWCEVCAIPMYEPKLCECCQDKNELRFQKKKLPKWFKPAKSKKK